jgi:hypothetical protein
MGTMGGTMGGGMGGMGTMGGGMGTMMRSMGSFGAMNGMGGSAPNPGLGRSSSLGASLSGGLNAGEMSPENNARGGSFHSLSAPLGSMAPSAGDFSGGMGV